MTLFAYFILLCIGIYIGCWCGFWLFEHTEDWLRRHNFL